MEVNEKEFMSMKGDKKLVTMENAALATVVSRSMCTVLDEDTGTLNVNDVSPTLNIDNVITEVKDSVVADMLNSGRGFTAEDAEYIRTLMGSLPFRAAAIDIITVYENLLRYQSICSKWMNTLCDSMLYIDAANDIVPTIIEKECFTDDYIKQISEKIRLWSSVSSKILVRTTKLLNAITIPRVTGVINILHEDVDFITDVTNIVNMYSNIRIQYNNAINNATVALLATEL